METLLHIAGHITAKHSSMMTSSNLQIMNSKTIEVLMTEQLATVELHCIIKIECWKSTTELLIQVTWIKCHCMEGNVACHDNHKISLKDYLCRHVHVNGLTPESKKFYGLCEKAFQ